MRILKWELEITDEQTVMMPVGAKLLDVQTQRGTCCLWALCDETAEQTPRRFIVYGTGPPVPNDPGEYVGTVMMSDERLVLHVFELDVVG